MGGFKLLAEDRNFILKKLISDQELCKALYYNETNFLDQPDIERTSQLIYRNIFPFNFIPPQEENEKRTYLTFRFRKFRPVNGFYKSGDIWINVFTNRDLYRTDYGVLRIDFIIDKVDELLNGIEGISIGKLQLAEMDEIYVNQNYSGSYLIYKTYDFNKLSRDQNG